MKILFKNLKYYINIINNKHIGEYTSDCAYFTILTFIPLLIVLITLTKYIGLDKQMISILLSDLIPNNLLNEAIKNIIKEVYSKSAGTITISAIFALWTATKGFFALTKGLSSAYDLEVKNKNAKFQIRSIFCTIIFIFLIIISLILIVFGNRINLILKQKFNIFNNLIQILIRNKVIIGIIVLTFVFSIMYKFVPKHNYKFKYQIPGAIFSAIACNVISIFYSIYVNVFTGFSVMYGSLTTIILALMWLYACMYSILIGAVINNEISKVAKIAENNNNL